MAKRRAALRAGRNSDVTARRDQRSAIAKFASHNNQLLGALEAASRKRIEPHLKPIDFKLGDIVCEAGGLLDTLIFRRAPSSHC